MITIYASSGPDVIASLTPGQYSTVYNVLSLAIASLGFTVFYLLLMQRSVAPRFRAAIIVSATVCGIATYHYFRIFTNFQESYPAGATVDAMHMLSNIEFNEGYRYVDWFLTVPLLLVETIAVLALSRSNSSRLLVKLVPAAALMIVLGYPGELTLETGPRVIWGVLSTLPFLYILYVLFVELTKALEGKSPEVRQKISNLRWLLVASWGVYPIAYAFPLLGGDFFSGADGFVAKQVGYSLADIIAKALFGILIYRLARLQSLQEDPDLYGDGHGIPAVKVTA